MLVNYGAVILQKAEVVISCSRMQRVTFNHVLHFDGAVLIISEVNYK